MDNTLPKLKSLIENLNASNSSLTKQEVLRSVTDPDLLLLIQEIHHPRKVFGITSKGVMKVGGLADHPDTLFEMLEMLANREVTGNAAAQMVNGFIHDNGYEYQDLVLNAIDKDLKTRVGVTLYNKVFGEGFIPEFKVALCDVYAECAESVDFEKDEWLASRKLDGCRCILRIENGEVSTWSRQGRRFETLGVLEQEFASLCSEDVVFDGEICIIDENGDEDFKSIMKEITRKNHTIKNPHYKIFDMLTLDEFDKRRGEMNLRDRQVKLQAFFSQFEPKYASINKQTLVNNKAHFEDMMDNARKNNWEGLVIRKNVPYEGKRTKNMLKCKEFADAEYIITGAEIGPFQVIENGLAVEREVLTNVYIEHKGSQVSVGSGFSLDQRTYYKDHLDELIGKTMTVQYFEETVDKDGNISLRFPTCKHIFDGKRNV